MKKNLLLGRLPEDKFVLQLYVCGMSAKSMNAIDSITRLCDEFLHDRYNLEIIDIYKNPTVAAEQQIVFSPSLIKRSPLPQKTLVGNFLEVERVLKGLGIKVEK